MSGFEIKLRNEESDPVIIFDNTGNSITISPVGKMNVVGTIPAPIALAAKELSEVITRFGTVGAEPSRAAQKLINVMIGAE